MAFERQYAPLLIGKMFKWKWCWRMDCELPQRFRVNLNVQVSFQTLWSSARSGIGASESFGAEAGFGAEEIETVADSADGTAAGAGDCSRFRILVREDTWLIGSVEDERITLAT